MEALENGYVTRYYELNALFAKTVVVKLKEIAELINEGLVQDYDRDIVDTSRPETWKYYLNLAGKYHPTDTMMTVVSIDTLETIEFTAENLRIHTATAKAHAYGTRQYHSLVYRYPKQEGLINGILNPADLNRAIAAESGTIVSYRKDLVELNEVTLVAELEAHLKRMIKRWFNIQFIMSDNLFCSVFYTMLSSFVLPRLLNLRLKRCKTPEAHSFHVRMYLASHGRLDRYLPYLSLKQSLWLYRNIAYLERNSGKVSQFMVLVEKLLTERGIPLGEYSLRHLDEFQENYRPVAMARHKLINADQNVLTHELYTLQDVFNKEREDAPGNARYFETYAARDIERIETANTSAIQTKMLDSSMVDYSNAVPEPFEVVALRQWCYMANKGFYDVAITFKDPKTSETRNLFAKDAFVYMLYVQLTSEGLSFIEIPEWLNMQQRIHPRPTVEDLLSVVPTKERDLRAIAEEIVARQPVIAPCHSVSAFYEQVETLTNEAYWHWFLISSMQDMYERALVENMIKRLYEDERVAFDLSSRYIGPWLQANNLPLYDFDKSEADLLVKAIYEAGTGLVVDNAKLLKNIQKAMLGLMTELSSYSIQITRNVNSDDLVLINWPAIRYDEPRQSQSDHRVIEVGSLVMDSRSHGREFVHTGITPELAMAAEPCPSSYQKTVEVPASPVMIAGISQESSVDLLGAAPYMEITYPGQNAELERKMRLPGYTTFENLPESFRLKLKSKYN